MMGTKTRSFATLPQDILLEDLVPEDNFYRRLEARLDLSFVRDLARPLYAGGGRPSVGPVLFFKLQLLMFLEDLRSERQLMRVLADRLSVRWYLGYDLYEALPDHCSLTRIRERYGLSVFRRFFSNRLCRSSASRPGWCGAKSCSSTPPRSRQTPRLTRRGRALWLRAVWRST
jgi:transposase